MSEVKTHPVQNDNNHHRTQRKAPQAVTLRAYEVYKHIYGEQERLITGNCRGGFGVGELVAFLYAYSFPKEEWRQRADEAFAGMKL